MHYIIFALGFVAGYAVCLISLTLWAVKDNDKSVKEVTMSNSKTWNEDD